jgi:hypothetical protein
MKMIQMSCRHISRLNGGGVDDLLQHKQETEQTESILNFISSVPYNENDANK